MRKNLLVRAEKGLDTIQSVAAIGTAVVALARFLGETKRDGVGRGVKGSAKIVAWSGIAVAAIRHVEGISHAVMDLNTRNSEDDPNTEVPSHQPELDTNGLPETSLGSLYPQTKSNG